MIMMMSNMVLCTLVLLFDVLVAGSLIMQCSDRLPRKARHDAAWMPPTAWLAAMSCISVLIVVCDLIAVAPTLVFADTTVVLISIALAVVGILATRNTEVATAAVPDPDLAVASVTRSDGLSGGADFDHLSAVSSTMRSGDSGKEKKKKKKEKKKMKKKETAKEAFAGFGDDDGADSSAGVQKEVAALKKRVAALEKENAALKKKKGGSSDAGVDFADAAPQNGSAAAASGEIVVFDAGEDEVVQAVPVGQKSACCVIV